MKTPECPQSAVEQVTDPHTNQLAAMIIRSTYQREGIEFFTPEHFPLQLAYMNRPDDYEIQPHLHCQSEKTTHLTQEVLVIRKGRLRVDFYDDKKCYYKSTLLQSGDIILLANGGHGFKVLEAIEIVEIKQGPYNSAKDKIRFQAVDDAAVCYEDREVDTC